MKRNSADGTVSLAEDHVEDMIALLEEAVYDIEAHAKQVTGINSLRDCDPRDRKRYDKKRVIAIEIRELLDKIGYQIEEVSE